MEKEKDIARATIGLDTDSVADRELEKPQYDLQDENTLWNSGIYCMSIRTCQEIIMKNSPQTWHYAYKAATESMQRKAKTLLNNEVILNHNHISRNSNISFDQIISFDYIMEKAILYGIICSFNFFENEAD